MKSLDDKVSKQLLNGFNSKVAMSINGMNHAIENRNYDRARAIQDAGTRLLLSFLPNEPDVQFYETEIHADTEGVMLPVGIFVPSKVDNPLPALLWIHGGGMMTGSYKQNQEFLLDMCKTLHCVIIGIDYRLAPEHPYPAAINDCYSALKWMFDEHEKLRIDAGNIAVGGASAGGNLAAAVALMARDKGDCPLVHQLLIYPMLDDTNRFNVDDQHPDTPLWTRTCNQVGWAAYLGDLDGSDSIPSYAAPHREENLKNLPSATLIVGEIDLFVDEGIVYARRLIQSGVSTALHVYPGAYHGFDFLANKTDIGNQFREAVIIGLKGAFNKNWINH